MHVYRPGRAVLSSPLLALALLPSGLLGACAHSSEGGSSISRPEVAEVSQGRDGLLRDYGSVASYAPEVRSGRNVAGARLDGGARAITSARTAAYVEEEPVRRPAFASASASVAVAPARASAARPDPQAGFEEDAASATMSVRVFGAERCEVDVSGEPRGPAPLNNLEVASGAQTVAVRCGSKADSREVELASGEHQELVFDFGATAAKPKTSKRTTKKSKRSKR